MSKVLFACMLSLQVGCNGQADLHFIVRSSKAWIARLHERYRVLTNYVDARNEIHIRWLR